MHLVGWQQLMCHICGGLTFVSAPASWQAVWQLHLPLLMCSLFFGLTTRMESCLIGSSRFELDSRLLAGDSLAAYLHQNKCILHQHTVIRTRAYQS
jgi:hypothetical protein